MSCAAILTEAIRKDDDAAVRAILNRQARGRISAAGSRISAWVLPTDEERMIARYTSQAVET
jgi:acetate kinase